MASNTQQRYSSLGANPFPIALDFIFGDIEKEFKSRGAVTHALIGIRFKAGEPIGTTVLPINTIEEVQVNRQKMINMFHMVAHVCEGWEAPPDRTDIAPSKHPNAREVVSIMLYAADEVCSALCPIDAKARSIIKGELMVIGGLGGNLKWDIPGNELAS